MQLRITLQTTSLFSTNDKLFSNYIFWSSGISRKCKLEGSFIRNNLCSYFICIFVLFYYIAERTYLKGVIGLSTSTAKRSHFSRRLTEIYGTKFTFESICEKEFKTLFRTPQFFLNCIVQTFVMPIMLFFILFVQDGNLKWITGYIDNPKSAGLAIGVGLCASLFLMGSNVIATTSFSRDGSSWFVNRYLPVKASDIFLRKRSLLG